MMVSDRLAVRSEEPRFRFDISGLFGRLSGLLRKRRPAVPPASIPVAAPMAVAEPPIAEPAPPPRVFAENPDDPLESGFAELREQVEHLGRRPAAKASAPGMAAPMDEALAPAPIRTPLAPRRARGPSGWRMLQMLWLLLLTCLGAGGGWLQWLGPLPEAATHTPKTEPAAPTPSAAPTLAQPATPTPAQPAPTQPAPPHPSPAQPAPSVTTPAAPPIPAPVSAEPARTATRLLPGAPVAGPDAALAGPGTLMPRLTLPRIAADGRAPRQVYAAGWNPADRAPRIAILLAGVGMNEADSLQAIADLPPEISLAFSPYAPRPAGVMAAARAGGHESLLSLPMEPVNYPLNDPGPLALLSSLAHNVNADRLERLLASMSGYAGVTTALGTLRGERFAGSDGMRQVLEQVAARGLLYVDARPGATPLDAPGLYARGADLVIDEPAIRSEIEGRLARLEDMARARGSALGIASGPLPVTVGRIAAWSTGLAARGLTLVPVSALTAPTDARP